jgi:hypothetical protein
MGDWWIDESPPVGPESSPTWAEIAKAYSNAAKAIALSIRSVGELFSGIETTTNVSSFDKLEKQLHAFTDSKEEVNKREIGKGRVQNHGPRAKTTFGRGGRKQY